MVNYSLYHNRQHRIPQNWDAAVWGEKKGGWHEPSSLQRHI